MTTSVPLQSKTEVTSLSDDDIIYVVIDPSGTPLGRKITKVNLGTALQGSDHGQLVGLTDDDHLQYVILAGRATGQVIYGGTASGDDLALRASSNATKGSILVSETTDVNLAPFGTSAGETTPIQFVELAANGTNYVAFKAPDAIAANVTWVLPNADGTANQVLKTDASGSLDWITVPNATGVSGGQTWNGGTDSGDDLRIDSTSNATKGYVTLNEDGGAAGGSVGIGIATPLAILHVEAGASGVTPVAGADTIVAEENGDAGISILTPNSSTGSLFFGDADDADVGGFTYVHSENTLSAYIGGVVEMVLTASGMTINGTQDPEATLHVQTSDGGVAPSADADDILVESSGNTGITILSSTSGTGNIHFGDSGDTDIGGISYNHSSNHMTFTTNGAGDIIFDELGSIGLGVDPADDNSFGNLIVMATRGSTTRPTGALGKNILYVSDNGGAHDLLYVVNSADVVSQLSPHNTFLTPEWRVKENRGDRLTEQNWVHYTEHPRLGTVSVDMGRLVREVERLSGIQLCFDESVEETRRRHQSSEARRRGN